MRGNVSQNVTAEADHTRVHPTIPVSALQAVSCSLRPNKPYPHINGYPLWFAWCAHSGCPVTSRTAVESKLPSPPSTVSVETHHKHSLDSRSPPCGTTPASPHIYRWGAPGHTGSGYTLQSQINITSTHYKLLHPAFALNTSDRRFSWTHGRLYVDSSWTRGPC